MSVTAITVPATDRGSAAEAYRAVMEAVAGQLAGLSAEQWEAPTDCAGWSVRALAAHLLGAQEDMLSVRTTLARRREGRRRYPHLSPLDAANQVQVDAHAGMAGSALVAAYRDGVPKVVRRVGSFPKVMARIPVDPTMAPAGLPLRLGYLFNVIYLRDAWMHSLDIARAVGGNRPVTAAEQLVAGQVMRDVAIEWGAGPGVDVELTGEASGTWRLGGAGRGTRLRGDGLQFFRGLSGREPETALELVDGDPEVAERVRALRILF